MDGYMNSLQYTPRHGFWRATTVVIMFTVSAIILCGAGPGNGGGTAPNLWLIIGLAIIPGSYVGVLQAF